MDISSPTSNQDCLLIRDHGPVRELILNQAQNHNSLNLQMTEALLDAIRASEDAPDIRALVISARGPSFCAGGDIKEMLSQGEQIAAYVDKAMREAHNPLILALNQSALPTICAVQGTAVGAGAGLALAADITVATREAKFQLPFVPKLAIMPDAGTSWFLTRALGYRKALGHLLTGEAISAPDAERAGLIWACVDADELESQALLLAAALARLPRATIKRCRELLAAAPEHALSEQLDLEHKLQITCFAEPTAREGLAAITQQRKPDFLSCENHD